MSLTSLPAADLLARMDGFSALIDARSESEFAQDHLPGALNWPSLNDEERKLIGTEYKQVSAFTAQKRGAAWVARNIANHLERHVQDLPRDWEPLIYCWRGGKRSGSLALVLSQIGFRVHTIEGGYRAFRREVLTALETAGAGFEFRILCGPTGSGKSQLLRALARRGAQVLDLEQLANHRGSVLGLVPHTMQPSQKQFETQIWNTLRHFDPRKPVFAESESRTVGKLRVPEALITRMRASACIGLDLAVDDRVTLLMTDYDFFVHDTPLFCQRLDALRTVRGHGLVDGWQEAARGGRTAEVVRALLLLHYDPLYLQSIHRNFPGAAQPVRHLPWHGHAAELEALVDVLLSA